MLPVRSVIIVLLGLCACSSGQEVEDYYKGNGQSSVVSARKNQDVSILKQIHSHNDDGSYTYGFEGSDGSFKIETKAPTGEVSGKYGYVDETGKLRTVEYGADKHGFQPSGEGITVPPPTLVGIAGHDDGDVDQEQYDGPQPTAQRPGGQPVKTPKAPYPPRRPANDQTAFDVPSKPRVFGSSYRPTSSRQMSPQPATDGPSASYLSVQQFNDAGIPSNVAGIPSTAFGGIPSAAGGPYRTYEDQEPVTEPPAPYQARRNGVANGSSAAARTASAVNYRTASRPMRTGSVLDQLAEQYALPQSSATRETHSFSF